MPPPAPLSVSCWPETIEALYGNLRRSGPILFGPHGERRAMPESVGEFLAELIAGLQAGKSVAIIHNEATLTTAEAAEMLGVSRQFLVKTLERGEIPFHKVGTHRRVYVRDLLEYRRRRDRHRRNALDELVQAEIAEGLYTIEPTNGEHR